MSRLSFEDWLGGAGRWQREAAWFDRENPQVYQKLVEFARRAKSRGVDHYGIGALFEVLRWHTRVEVGAKADEWKFNNNYRAYYARKIMDSEPDLKDFFETRVLRSETVGE